MKITVRLLASYRRYLPPGHDDNAGYQVDVPSGTTVGRAIEGLPLPTDDPYTFLVNGGHAQRDQVLVEGDLLAIFPAVGGG